MNRRCSILPLIVFITIGIQSILTDEQLSSAKELGRSSCQKPTNGTHLCYCGVNRNVYDRLKGETCVKGIIIKKPDNKQLGKQLLRSAPEPIYRSLRDDHVDAAPVRLIARRNTEEPAETLVPLRNISIEAWIDTFAADVTINQVFVNEERSPIEAVYIFPIEENAAVYSFTAQIDDRTIVAELKEKNTAEQEYKTAISQGQTAVLLRQSEQTLDTFTINVGSLAPGKTCVITIKYVSELEMVDGSSIRFVVPTTISPRYNPSLGHLQSPDGTPTKYTQKTPYSLWFQAHVARGEQYKINQVANVSHPVDAKISEESIDISMSSIALDHDIILDIDLPKNRPTILTSTEKDVNTGLDVVLLSFAPRLSDFWSLHDGQNESNSEFIFIVDCSGSMSAENRIPLAREAMLLFLRSLPLDSHFNIIRFGSSYDVLFKTETMTVMYNETTAKTAENMIRSMEADFGGTELLDTLAYLKSHPVVRGRSRQIFLLTDGEISNTDEVIDLARSMSSSTRIFSIGLGDSPSRSLVKGLARATNGYFTFIPPNAKVDTYVASQFDRALQPSLVDARLEWHGIDHVGQQAPTVIPPLYINDRVLVYQMFDGQTLSDKSISVDVMVDRHQLDSIDLPKTIDNSRGTIRRLAAKALIQELQHAKMNDSSELSNATKEAITKLSLSYQILSPYTAFVGVEKKDVVNENSIPAQTRYIPIQMNQDDAHLLGFGQVPLSSGQSGFTGQAFISRPMSMGGGGGGGGHGASVVNINVNLDAAAMSQMDSDTDEQMDLSTTTVLMPHETTDLVRWLIDRQSFNGAWILDDQDVSQVTDGKSLSSMQITSNRSRDVITTALAIAVLESKYADQMKLWKAVVNKARKQLESEGLTNSEMDTIINQIKTELFA